MGRTTRVKAVIAYDGSHYYGFQKQLSTALTITQEIEDALKSLNIESSITGSGRTDKGVHATGQVIHFDIPNYWKNLEKLKENLNRKLEHIFFKNISKVDKEFHARFSAKRRTYRYVFKSCKPSIFEQRYISYYDKFDKNKLQKALKLFKGKHDFNLFRKTGTITHTSTREVYRLSYKKRGAYHFIYIEANGFLRSQVRMIVEASMQYAKGDIEEEAIQEQLLCQKKNISSLAPPEGLYLARVIY